MKQGSDLMILLGRETPEGHNCSPKAEGQPPIVSRQGKYGGRQLDLKEHREGTESQKTGWC